MLQQGDCGFCKNHDECLGRRDKGKSLKKIIIKLGVDKITKHRHTHTHIYTHTHIHIYIVTE